MLTSLGSYFLKARKPLSFLEVISPHEPYVTFILPAVVRVGPGITEENCIEDEDDPITLLKHS